MNSKYNWLNKKSPRSLDQLRLWPENPRLNPEENHIQLSDYVEDFIAEDADKKQFFKLIKSIADDGFIPADPVVVWQNKDNQKFYVAEGNRRVLVLKLLREPNKAPKSIRSFIRKHSTKLNINETDKILVNVAPTFEDAEWYINQRNSTSSLQKSWSRIQQLRWISELYDKYKGDISKITSITKMTQSELESFIRILRVKDLVHEKNVADKLTAVEFAKASSYKFPITILERFFSNKSLKEKWGIDYDGIDLVFKNKNSFLNAYAELIKNIINEDSKVKIDTRTITTNFDEIINSLPSVDINNSDLDITDKTEPEPETPDDKPKPPPPKPIIKNNPNRNRLILNIYNLNTSSYRLNGLFYELKLIPIKYNNSIAASIRVFLDLAVLNYIEGEGLIGELCGANPNSNGLKNINLSLRLEFIKTKLNSKSKSVIQKILNPSNELSLDVLNGYIHSSSSPYLNNQFLNNFWDLLFPLFEELLEINETNI
jgi:hypothetical protein